MQTVHEPPRYGSGQYLAIASRGIAEDFSKDFRVRSFWTPGHKSIALNKQADLAAKESAEYQAKPLRFKSSLDKGHTAVILRLQSNHNSLNNYLYRFNLTDSNRCQTCLVPP
ncbi:hypothetical protein CROQUDRAFT_165301 [Cronartium quercuum f. sp. fusiforme G11]|uniref:Uncharacterized protein n=1 Tax=Cronartium quercuum f. sp. fusiforme G11 TaxID=708437 RepID=A0A9P6NGW3_9BASI|nr:hypothetical protein CROQUDRAFT_165301 [Cronartium quercuum f. sp. fusiforme G11]